MIKPRTLLILALLFAFGMTIEALKKIAALPTDEQGPTAIFSLKNYDFNAFHVVDTIRETIKSRILGVTKKGMTLANVTPEAVLPEQYDFSEGHKVAEEATPKEGDDPAADEAKKKKKKKKKKKSAREDADLNKKNDEEPVKAAQDEDEKSNEGEVAPIDGGYAGNSATTPEIPEEQLPVTFDDWAKLVLGQPNAANVAKLVQFFQNSMVTSEVFYGILTAMMNESSDEQHHLATYAASQVSSPTSFIFLVDVLKSESQGSTLASKVNLYLNAYEALGMVNHLHGVFSQKISDPVTMQLTTEILDRSTLANLERRVPSNDDTTPDIPPVDGPAEPPTRPSRDNPELQARQRRAKAAQIYSRFIAALDHVIAAYTNNAEIATPARRTLERIKTVTVVLAQTND